MFNYFMCCGRRLLFSILSVVILGLSFVSQVINAVSAYDSAFGNSNNGNFIFQLIIAIIFGLILIFALYASIWGNICSRIVLSVILIIEDAIILIVAIVLFCMQSSINNAIEKQWIDPKNIDKLLPYENEYECCGWENQTLENRNCSISVTCKGPIEDYIETYVIGFGVVMIILFIVLTVGIVILIIEAKGDIQAKKEAEKEDERFMVPFAYGWNT